MNNKMNLMFNIQVFKKNKRIVNKNKLNNNKIKKNK